MASTAYRGEHGKDLVTREGVYTNQVKSGSTSSTRSSRRTARRSVLLTVALRRVELSEACRTTEV